MIAVYNQYFVLTLDEIKIYNAGDKLKSFEKAKEVRSKDYYNLHVQFKIDRVDLTTKTIHFSDIEFVPRFRVRG